MARSRRNRNAADQYYVSCVQFIGRGYHITHNFAPMKGPV